MLPVFRAAFEVLRCPRLLPPGGLIVARSRSLIVLERSRIATRVSVSFGASDSHSLVVLILLHARCGIVVVVFLHARRGLRYVQQTSLMRGGLPSCPVRPSVCAAVLRSAQHRIRGVLPFCSARHARRSSVPPGAACAAVFRSARRGMRGVLPFCPVWHARLSSVLVRHAWRSSVLPSVACVAVFRSARRGIRGSVPFCLVRPGMRGGVPFWLARPGVRGGVPFRPARHMRPCSVLSGAARYARRCSVLSGAGQVTIVEYSKFKEKKCCKPDM